MSVKVSESDKLYKKLDYKASAIVRKLRDEIAIKGYRENIGQNELMKYEEEVDSCSSLNFQERYQLKTALQITIDNL